MCVLCLFTALHNMQNLVVDPSANQLTSLKWVKIQSEELMAIVNGLIQSFRDSKHV